MTCNFLDLLELMAMFLFLKSKYRFTIGVTDLVLIIILLILSHLICCTVHTLSVLFLCKYAWYETPVIHYTGRALNLKSDLLNLSIALPLSN